MAGRVLNKYGSTRSHDKERFGRRDSLTSNSSKTAYINDAFAFLHTQDYSAYKHYEDGSSANVFPQYKNVNNNSSRHNVYAISSNGNFAALDGANGVTATNYSTKEYEDDSLEDRGCCSKRKCICTVLVTLVIIVLAVIAFVALYVIGIINFGSDTEQPEVLATYEGIIKINETWSDDLYNPSSSHYKNVSSEVISTISVILDQSQYSGEYSLEFTSIRPGSIEVLFKLYLYTLSTLSEVLDVLVDGLKSLQAENKLKWNIDPDTGVILEALLDTTTQYSIVTTNGATETTRATDQLTTLDQTSSSEEEKTDGRDESTDEFPMSTTTPVFEIITQKRTTLPPATCEKVESTSCSALGFTFTGFPNSLGHTNQDKAAESLLGFLEPLRRNCYEDTLLFACAFLYPKCTEEGKLIGPCKSFCDAFRTNCRYPILCDHMVEDDSEEACIPMPNHDPPTSPRPDFQDPCSESQYLCGNDECVDTSKRCDNNDDCGDFSDELGCAGEVVSVLDCNFESGTPCAYQDYGHFNWTMTQGRTQTPGTGPLYDHTTRSGDGYYALAEASGKIFLDRADLVSPDISLASENCLRFYYHLYGEAVEKLEVIVTSISSGEETFAWRRTGNHGDFWKYGQVTLESGDQIVTFAASRGDNHLGDIAIDDITLRPGTCPEIACSNNEFTCSNGDCLPAQYKCDGKNDCGDYGDEMDCECTSEQFQCNMGLCILAYHQCDNVFDCPDHSDELNCVCPQGQYKCNNGTCIMREWLCDRELDCPYGEDEENCATCSSEQFQCTDYGCVEMNKRCDGIKDCADGSDEHGCVRTRLDGVTEIYREEWLPLCAENFPESEDNSMCRLMGYSGMIGRSTVESTNSQYFKYDTAKDRSENSTILNKLITSSSCESSLTLAIECIIPSCGTPTISGVSPFIVNGRDASLGEWPWHIGLLANGVYTCGGTIVSPYHVITAAHCLSGGFPAESYQVRVGSLYRIFHSDDPNLKSVNVKSIIKHPQYSVYYLGYDIAILVLAEKLEFNDYIQPACLPEPDEYFTSSSTCYSTGWGMTDGYDDNSLSETLQEAKMKYYPESKCMKNYFFVSEDIQCAGYDSGYISNCQGDSGGPLVCQRPNGLWILVGTFSFITRGCSIAERPSAFTKVQNFIPWIDDEIACQFTCDSGKCLYDVNDICDGYDDCGDFSDETRLCSPSVSCDFESTYTCGYQAPLKGPANVWRRYQVNRWSNKGPFVDHTIGDGTGHFLYGGNDASTFLSPVIEDTGTVHCLRFRYYMRSEDAGSFRVFALQNVPTDQQPYQLDPYENRVSLRVINGNQGDIWYTDSVDLPSGRIVVGFEAVAAETGGNNPSHVALDDVELLDGTCESQTCEDDEGTCGGDGICYSTDEKCNYRVFCVQETDEMNCPEGSKNTYDCDLENYQSCGLEQSITDFKDWRLVLPSTEIVGDDISTTSPTGRMLYVDWRFVNAGEYAEVSLSLHTSGTIGCMYLTYTMFSSGSFLIRFLTAADTMETAWAHLGYYNRNWVDAQIPIPVGARMVTIRSTAGYEDNEDDAAYATYAAISRLVLKDEECDIPACRPGEFQCGNGQCVDKHFYCDGHTDCIDESDETNCTCLPDSFKCADGSCLSGHVRCNGFDNCADGSDEESCKYDCHEGEYQCMDGTCMSRSTWCDGIVDCLDGSDEGSQCVCFSEQWLCEGGIQCIMGFRYCDGKLDCNDGSDEDPSCICNEKWHFECKSDYKCIPLESKCDDKVDCDDGSDEFNCTCKANQFQCNDHSCISEELFCNGQPNCKYGEDELEGCECGVDGFRCASGGCINKLLECDFHLDCIDGSDEHIGCECPPGDVQCPKGLCILPSSVCDGYNDCGDFFDEQNCTCNSGDFHCANGLCLNPLYRCNGNDDCGDESDEENCACKPEEHQCPDSKCIQKSWLCDGDNDCKDGSDEAECDTCDKATEYTCADYNCISIDYYCDGYENDCPDNSDEKGCVAPGVHDDQANIIHAYDGYELVPVCSQGIKQEWLNQICTMMGQGSPLVTADMVILTGENFMQARPEASDTFGILQLEWTDTCPGNSVLMLQCRELQCGRPSDSVLSQPSPFIIGGDIAQDGKWPWTLALMFRDEYRCSAVLIDSQWALSAAHCFIWSNGNTMEHLAHYFSLRAGTNSLVTDDDNTQKLDVKKIILHPTYTAADNGFRYHDIALIQLEEEVVYTDHILPVCMPEKDRDIPRTSTCYVSGWGYTKAGAGKPADQLREGKMELWSSDRCQGSRAWGNLLQAETQTCAGYDNGYIATCFGDSGGGLMCKNHNNKWVLSGLTSVGEAGCVPADGGTARPGVYTTVTSYHDWIYNTIALNE